MRISLAEQGTLQWKQERAGVITGSGMAGVLTTKMALSTSHRKYAARLAAELVTGAPQTKDYKSEAMEKGSLAESGAFERFNEFTRQTYEQIGLVFKDDEMRIGCSPDLVLWSGNEIVSGLEAKNPEAHTHIEYLEKLEEYESTGECPYYQQVQGCIWVCNTDHWWFQSLCPGLKPFRLRVARNDAFVEAMERHCATVIEATDRIIAEHGEMAA